MVAEAVHALTQRQAVVTVNAIAQEIGIDQSGASRLVNRATAAGYLTVMASEGDGRCRQVTITRSGTELLQQAHDWQEQVFAWLTGEWSEARRREFRQAMLDLTERSYLLDARSTPGLTQR